MALPLWGQLEKAVDDPQTIVEAIEQMISAHNEDPDAHLGSNQSLESHKQENVIDHPAGSVLADKTTDREYLFSPTFESIANWDTSGEVINSNPGTLSLYIEDGFADFSSIETNLQAFFRYIDLTKDFLFEMYCRTDTSTTDYDIYFGLGNPAGSPPDGLYFHLTGGQLVGRWSYFGSGIQTNAIPHDFTTGHFYRIRYDATDEIAYFMIDGQQVATLDLSAQDYNTDSYLMVGFENTAANDGYLHCGGVRTSRALI